MKRPILYLSTLFVVIISSTVIVSTAICSICQSFYQNETEKNSNIKATPVDKHLNDDPIAIGFKQVTVKL